MSVDPILRLLEVTRSISGVLDLDELLHSILTQAGQMLGAERGYLLMLHTDESRSLAERLQVKAAYQCSEEEFNEDEFHPSRSTIINVLNSGQAQYQQDALASAHPSRSVELFGLRSILCEPLVVQNRLLGVIYLDSRVHNRFSPWCREIMPSLAAQAAICIENANLVLEREEALRREHAEQVHAREMEAWKNAMAAFVSIASHDLKGPLTALQGGLDLLRRYNLPDNTRPVVDDLVASLTRARRLVEMYLDASALQEGRLLSGPPEPVAVRELVQQEMDFQYSQLSSGRKQRYSFHNEIPADLMVFADRERVLQILSNLLENALKYGLGKITARAGLEEGKQAWIEVEDEGQGLSEQALERVFDRYYRAENSTGTRGTGLGLWIVNQLVEGQGGHIRAFSEPGKGARFRLTLPQGPSDLPLPAPQRTLSP